MTDDTAAAGGAGAPDRADQAGASNAEATPGNQRRAGNYLLQPLLQIRLGLYNVVLAICFGLAILGIVRAFLVKLRGWMEISGAPHAVRTLGESYLDETLLWLVLATALFLVASIVISVVLTHRLVGPTVAFRRHLERLTAGDYTARTRLRRDDAFGEVAEDLNRLSEALQRGAAEGQGSDRS